jgi:hypothetical protein
LATTGGVMSAALAITALNAKNPTAAINNTFFMAAPRLPDNT